MAKRQGKRRVDSTSIQGEGTWVEIDALTVKEVRQMRKAANEADYDSFEGGLDAIKKHVIGWNWVDYDESSLPAPRSFPDVVDTLTMPEINFLANALLGEDDASKN